VTKVHREAQAHFKRGRRIILIGHGGHPEVIRTIGQLPPGAVTDGRCSKIAAQNTKRNVAKRQNVIREFIAIDSEGGSVGEAFVIDDKISPLWR
jgi:4-hydroxy-3-methylbut-2-enyl diphosphate reductase IspH